MEPVFYTFFIGEDALKDIDIQILSTIVKFDASLTPTILWISLLTYRSISVISTRGFSG